MPKLDALTVCGYKSIRELRDFKLGNLNVLIGANGAGKSNFIGLFRFLNEMYKKRLQVFIQLQGGPDAVLHFGRKKTELLQAEFLFDTNAYEGIPLQKICNSYSFKLSPTPDNRLIFSEELIKCSGTKEISSTYTFGEGHDEAAFIKNQESDAFFVHNALNRWRVFHINDTSDQAKVKQVNADNDNLILKPDAANLAAYLQMLYKKHRSAYESIVSTIQLVAPFFNDFVHREEDSDYIELEWTQKGNEDTPFKAHMLSDGTLRFICLATLLLQPVKLLPDTILIDEPELGLHPYAIGILASIFKQVSEDKQLIVSTQSVELINHLSPEDVIVVDQEDGASTFRRFKEDELKEWLKDYSLGELWNKNVLGGRP